MLSELLRLLNKEEGPISLVDFLEASPVDIIGEIDLVNDTFKYVYHIDAKYGDYNLEQSYSALRSFILQNVVHPDDVEAYLSLPSLEVLRVASFDSNCKNYFFSRYRIKEANYDDYRDIEEVIIVGKDNYLEPGVARFYVYDVTYSLSVKQGKRASTIFGDKNKLTGLLEKYQFLLHAHKKIDDDPSPDWCVASIDLDHFKLFDSWYGRTTSDYLLSRIGEVLKGAESTYDAIGGYFGHDDFALLIKYDEKAIQSIYEQIEALITTFDISFGFLPIIGVAFMDEKGIVIDAYDKALIAADRVEANSRKRIQLFSDEIYVEAEKEFSLLNEFLKAMKNDEITFYLQPQCRLSTSKIITAESLCRWVKKDGTFIPPNDFIPILEKYGFITDLDKCVWEKVCKFLRETIDKGITPVPISLNVSRIDIYAIDIPTFLKSLLEKYQLDGHLLEVEITESAYVDNLEKINALVQELMDMGIKVLMDDFGSGYSSLNMLSSVKVDVVKIDAQFLNFKDSNYEKGIHVLESVVNMTKVLSIPIIMEGVENDEQVKFLFGLGCRYVQGFHFYRPMPVDKFEKLIKYETNIDRRGVIFKHNEQFRLKDFLDENVYSDSMLNSIIGPVGIYVWDNDDKINIIRYNTQFYNSVAEQNFNERLLDIAQYMPKDDPKKFKTALTKAMKDKLNGSRSILRFYRSNGFLTSYVMQFYYLGEQAEGRKFYVSINDISELVRLHDEMGLIVDYSSDTIVFLKHYNNNSAFTFHVACHGLKDATGLSMEELQKEFDDGSIFNRVGDTNKSNMMNLARTSYKEVKSKTIDLPFITKNGNTINLILKIDPVTTSDKWDFILNYRLA